jgi:hypothetical protein
MPLQRFVIVTSALILFLATAVVAQEPFEEWEATRPEIQSALEDGRVTRVQPFDASLARIEAYVRRGPRSILFFESIRTPSLKILLAGSRWVQWERH